jgi:hypothetical protein
VSRCLGAVAVASDKARATPLTRQALSGIYNIAYYRGVADELGGAQRLWEWIDS